MSAFGDAARTDRRRGSPWRGRGRGRSDRRGRGGRDNQLENQEESGTVGRGERRSDHYRNQRRPRATSWRGRGRGGRRDWDDAQSASSDGSHARPRGRYHRGRGRGARDSYRARRAGPQDRSGRRATATPMTHADIQELAALESEVLVKRIDSQLKEFQLAIGEHGIAGRPEVMDAIVQILTKVTSLASKRDVEEQSIASKIIAEILSERSDQFHFHLNRAVKVSACTITQVECFYRLFFTMLKTFESLAWECLPIDELRETTKRLTQAGSSNSELLKVTNELCEIRDQIRETHSSSEPKVPASLDGERDDSAFRSIPLLPDWKEICRDNGIPPEVCPNQVNKCYRDWTQYYDIQFRLIREDFIAPLRRGVTAFLHGDRGKKNRDVKTYSGAVISTQVTTKDKGICFTVKFDASGFRRVNYNWDHSKRLIFGSLLCFIPTVKTSDDSIIFATVTDRDSRELINGKFMVQFEGDILIAMTHCSKKTEFEIVESNSYFEATRPILRSIQKAEDETMPFTRQLIEGECGAVEPPGYLCAKEVPPVYDLSCLHGSLKKRRHKPPLMIEVLNKADWEKANNTELDTSQLQAIQAALTQGIAVIQGPPGTGKTYIGLKIVESLLTNRAIWDPRRSCPILVMCYTNHALDQFLEGIIDTKCCGRKLDVIRIGGRCKNEKVEEYNLNKVRRKAPRRFREFSREIAELREELEMCNPEKIWRKLNGYYYRTTLLPMNILRYVAHPYHVYQLTQMAKCAKHEDKEVEVWLGLWKETFCNTKARGNENSSAQGVSKEKHEQGDKQKNQAKEEVGNSAAQGVSKEKNEQGYKQKNQAKEEVGNSAAQGVSKEKHEQGDKQKNQAKEEVGNSAAQGVSKEKNEQGYKQKHQAQEEAKQKEEEIGNENSSAQGVLKGKNEQGDKQKIQAQEEAKQKEEEVGKEEELLELEGEATIEQDERMDDDDVEGYQAAQLPNDHFQEVANAPIMPYYNGNNSDEADEENVYDKNDSEAKHAHKKTKWTRRNDADKWIKGNLFKDPMDDEEAGELDHADISSLCMKDRWRLYNYWAEKRFKYLQEVNREQVNEYSEKCKELAELRQDEDRYILESVDVIGMTTTGAAKYQHILHNIKPKIVIVEEAAEVLEAHIVSALNAGTQHLILIGDHKQLRPKPNEYVLATKYNLSVSLFERLIRNKVSCATLEIQHRMRPEIARLVCPHVYDKLLNHESVEKYPNVQGISKNLFFINHAEPENEDQNLLSYQNDFEARYIVSLCAHLFKLGYSASQITILTSYVGQLLKLRAKMPRKEFEGVRITAIDNFQGEENDIILFSMVRSTNPHSGKLTIGFLKEDNRVCVSLSRAKHGFYAIGNFQLIRQQSVLWESIIFDVEQRGCFGDALPLYCCNHPETTFVAKKESDFSANAPNGGCKKECDIRLPCGHSCTQKCHIINREHIDFKCWKPCQRKCSYNHPCKSKHYCFQKCPPCREMVERVMPNCGHTQVMPCFANPLQTSCNAPCSKSCVDGHQCQKLCYEDCGECLVEIEKEIPVCKHKQMVPCCLSPFFFKCQAPCPKLCQNGLHPCPKKCSEPCVKCRVPVLKTVPICGHSQNIQCYKEPNPATCRAICEKLCPNELHNLTKQCCGEWPICKEKISKTLPKCGHEILAQCFKDPSQIPCPLPCTKSCEVGHECPKACHEQCAPCLTKVKKTLECGHRHVMQCSQAQAQTFKCPTQCSKQLCVREHECKQVCHYPLPCEPCTETVSIQMPLCFHKQSLPCFKSVNPQRYGYTCKHPCEKLLECGHRCQKSCGEKCTTICSEKVTVELICGHHMKIECHRKNQKEEFLVNCKKVVSIRLACGHTIRTECWKGKDKAILQKECKERCTKPLKCGHVCHETCGASCTEKCKRHTKKKRQLCGHEMEFKCYQMQEAELHPCTKKCRNKLSCGHPCKNSCGEPCSCPLKSTRQYPCGHSRKIPCNSTIDAHPCQKKCEFVLSCGHCCSGKCGDCYSSRMHAICIFQVRVLRYCGHSETIPCAGLSDACHVKQHTIPCTHDEDYTKCHKVCRWDCKHIQCENECSQECNRPPCNELCDEVLPCGHQCSGICGERCLSVCWQCDKEKFMKQFYPKKKRGRQSINPPFFELGCGHIFTLQYLDEYMVPNSTIMPKQCPRCHQVIGVGNRYGNAVRRAMTDVENVSIVVRESATISAIEREDLVSSSEAITSYHLYDIQRKLRRGVPVTSEEKCLYQCVISHANLQQSLQKHVEICTDVRDLITQLNNTVSTLLKFAEKGLRLVPEFGQKHISPNQFAKVHLSVQLLDDFMSELYRISLCAQCLIFRKCPSLKSPSCTTRLENAVERVNKYVCSLNPLKDRITEIKYTQYSSQISEFVSDLAGLHVQTPSFPVVTKGTWMKCTAGHYYCIPPTCGSGSKPVHKCPNCL